jgi:hypothetical protein
MERSLICPLARAYIRLAPSTSFVQGGPTVRPGVDRETSYEITRKGPCRQAAGGWHYFLRQDVANMGGKSGVSGRTRLLPGTLAHALVVLQNALPTGHENYHTG